MDQENRFLVRRPQRKVFHRKGAADIELAVSVSIEIQEEVDPLKMFLPSPPTDVCLKELQEKINKFLALKRHGKSFNANLRNRKDYRNPDFLQHTVRYQIGACFSKDVFDPHGWRIKKIKPYLHPSRGLKLKGWKAGWVQKEKGYAEMIGDRFFDRGVVDGRVRRWEPHTRNHLKEEGDSRQRGVMANDDPNDA
ncbi:hypothetical protein QJS10_CPA01g01815 [Acorus calamus]|uniref:Uncharacterized protein n=1 Tax=Acorus calamus TaxID=4465 RepID=A0AAV9FPC0_ACOCL|nr:hypothetical protein QJS10_CPA01g01815 [Acorus calamus]